MVQGANNSGQLGIGIESEQETLPVPITFPKPGNQIIDICPGSNFCLILDSDGIVYGSGSISPDLKFSQFTALNNRFGCGKVHVLACGWNFALFLTDSELYGLGSNKYKQLDPYSSATNFKTFTKIQQTSKTEIKQLNCSLRNSAIVYRNGKAKLFGKNFNETIENIHVQKVAFGESHALLLDENGLIFVKGSNKFGQLNRNRNIPLISTWSKLDLNDKIVDIFSGWYHSVLITAFNQAIYCCGRNTYGQLGIGLRDHLQFELFKVPKIQNCISCAVGSQHNLFINNKNELFSWGWNEHGSCGNGTTIDCFQPTKILNGNCFSRVFAGFGQSFAITL